VLGGGRSGSGSGSVQKGVNHQYLFGTLFDGLIQQGNGTSIRGFKLSWRI
jgi:hypothetical protein